LLGSSLLPSRLPVMSLFRLFHHLFWSRRFIKIVKNSQQDFPQYFYKSRDGQGMITV